MLARFWGHLRTVQRHRRLVFRLCRGCGLFWQGLTHDLSKYSPEEFYTGVKYFSGDRSPNDVDRRLNGMSRAWLHHKGRNKHHLEYWIDYRVEDGCFTGLQMPLRYIVESVCDRIAASSVYRGALYTDRDPLDYYLKSREYYLMHPETDAAYSRYLEILARSGESACLNAMKEDLVASAGGH